MQLLLATSNKGKAHEMREALDGLPLELLDLRDVNVVGQPEETGNTFEENAVRKAVFYSEMTGLPSVADDSDIMVEAIQNELGIHTRRWGAGADASDQEWIEYFLARMKKEKNKHARFVCSLAYIGPDGTMQTFEGRCGGVITDTLEAVYLPGLPLSACFKPDGYSLVFSALSIEQKNNASHRGQALMQLREFLKKHSIS